MSPHMRIIMWYHEGQTATGDWIAFYVCVCVAQDRSIALTAQQHHPKDSDAEWNSNQHPTWPQALSEEFDPAVNK